MLEGGHVGGGHNHLQPLAHRQRDAHLKHAPRAPQRDGVRPAQVEERAPNGAHALPKLVPQHLKGHSRVLPVLVHHQQVKVVEGRGALARLQRGDGVHHAQELVVVGVGHKGGGGRHVRAVYEGREGGLCGRRCGDNHVEFDPRGGLALQLSAPAVRVNQRAEASEADAVGVLARGACGSHGVPGGKGSAQ